MKNKKIAFLPNWSKGNPYQNLLKASCEKFNTEVEYHNIPVKLFPFSHFMKKEKHIEIIHLHWISEIISRISWSKKPFVFWFKCFALILDCFWVRINGVKLVWTIHNKVSHEGYNRKKELWIRKLLCLSVNKIILHSNEAVSEVSEYYQIAIKNKTHVIFHGNYSNCYPVPKQSAQTLRSNDKILDNDIVILFFGSLKPYKGIETLISTFKQINKNAIFKLIIAGAPHNAEYKEELQNLCRLQKSVLTDFQYIPDKDLVNYLTIADVVVLPFSDTLTSGSAILAMTYGKSLILPNTAKVFGCVPTAGVEYFESESELVDILNSLDKEKLKIMGNVNIQKSLTMNWEEVGKLTTDLYNEISPVSY
jgi:glycosyltransferase involved in cell wall biosynthesis